MRHIFSLILPFKNSLYGVFHNITGLVVLRFSFLFLVYFVTGVVDFFILLLFLSVTAARRRDSAPGSRPTFS